MPRARKSQWDFGDLFAGTSPSGPVRREVPPPAPPTPPSPPPTASEPDVANDGRPEPGAPPRRVYSVTELTAGIRRQLENAFGSVSVAGEVSNYRLQASGHAYFVLKDARCQVNCVLFRGQGGAGREGLRDGARVILGGELTVYEPRGQYQLRVLSVELEGIGALQAAFEKLKAGLAAEGLFDAARKRPIPRFPRRVGLVTSATGAAIRDVLHVVQRRFAGLEFVLVPVRVQGTGAAEEIAGAVELLNRYASGLPDAPQLDVLLLTRGGGSLEDLWAFNEERVARAIAASRIPVVSAVGHEIDFTIADFVADLRAATPSAAAEVLTQAYVDSRTTVAESARRATWLVRRHLEDLRDQVEGVERRLARMHPRRQLGERAQRLDEAGEALVRAVRRQLEERRRRSSVTGARLVAVRPAAVLARRRQDLAEWRRRLPLAVRQEVLAARHRWSRAMESLRLLSPENTLERGYSITFVADSGKVVRTPADVDEGDLLRTRVKGGDLGSRVVSQVLRDGSGQTPS